MLKQEKVDREQAKKLAAEVRSQDVPAQLQREMGQAVNALDELHNPKIPPEEVSTLHDVLKPLPKALKEIQDKRLSPETKKSIEKVGQVLLIELSHIHLTPPEDLDRLSLIAVELDTFLSHCLDGKSSADEQHTALEVTGVLSTVLVALSPASAASHDDRDAIDQTVEPLIGALKGVQDPGTSPQDRKNIEKAVHRLSDAIKKMRDHKASKQDREGARNAVRQATVELMRLQGCPDVEIIYVHGFTPRINNVRVEDHGEWVTDPLKRQLSPLKVGIHVLQHPGRFAAERPSDSIESVHTGTRKLVTYVQDRHEACPNQKFVLIGYSMGANIVTNALPGGTSEGALVGARPEPGIALDPQVTHSISTIVLFGNPSRKGATAKDLPKVPKDYRDKTLDICIPNDPVCGQGKMWNPTKWLDHFTPAYAGRADGAAKCVSAALDPGKAHGCKKEELTR
ncbi:cutinase family protein [Streptomyces sp. NPDC003395]